ncbi:MAG: peptidoglycan editing factor PgeF [Pseudomonadota bacterium]
MTEPGLYQPVIDLPKGIKAFVTTRNGGFSEGPWQSFNLGEHVKDDPAAVAANRALLKQQLVVATGSSSLDLQWLNQVHGTTVHHAHGPSTSSPPQADALYTNRTNLVCGVLTADCLPVLFSSTDGQEIAVAHAGWRGLQKGVLEKTIACFNAPPAQIIAWMGPAIGPCHFEVGDEVREAFLESAQEMTAVTENAFLPSVNRGKWFADLYQLARIRLLSAGLTKIGGEPTCTVCENARWYSYRHSPLTGRFATLIVKTT